MLNGEIDMLHADISHALKEGKVALMREAIQTVAWSSRMAFRRSSGPVSSMLTVATACHTNKKAGQSIVTVKVARLGTVTAERLM